MLLPLLDLLIIAVYVSGILAIGFWVSRRQSSEEEYYIAGRAVPGWAVALSALAAQGPAISFVSIPAFVALRPEGGLKWLQYEVARPWAMIIVMAIFVPIYRRTRVISAYEIFEHCLGRDGIIVRRFICLIFLTCRALSAGVSLYASAVIMRIIVGKSVPLWGLLITIMTVTLIYATVGGMRAVIWTDALQMGVLICGLLIMIALGIHKIGWLRVMYAFPQERWRGIGKGWGLFEARAHKNHDAPLPALLLGGFIFYVSYFGADQSQVQRLSSAPSTFSAQYVLFINGLLHFPLTALFSVLGVVMYANVLADQDLMEHVGGKEDNMIPQFILHCVPTGLRGIVVASLVSSSMSSLDSALNSLSAATKRDFFPDPWSSQGDLARNERARARDRIEASAAVSLRSNSESGLGLDEVHSRSSKPKHGDHFSNQGQGIGPRAHECWEPGHVAIPKSLTILWGVVIALLALFAGTVTQTMIEAIILLGSFFFGPILAAFAVALVWPAFATSAGIIGGTISAVAVSACLALYTPNMHFMWYNLIGFAVGLLVALWIQQIQGYFSKEAPIQSDPWYERLSPRSIFRSLALEPDAGEAQELLPHMYYVLGCYGMGILVFCYSL